MFDFEINEARRVILVRFRGELSESDFAALDAEARNRRGGEQYDCVFDLTDVEKIELATEFVSNRGSCRRYSRTGSGSTLFPKTTSTYWSDCTPLTKPRRVGARRSLSRKEIGRSKYLE